MASYVESLFDEDCEVPLCDCCDEPPCLFGSDIPGPKASTAESLVDKFPGVAPVPPPAPAIAPPAKGRNKRSRKSEQVGPRKRLDAPSERHLPASSSSLPEPSVSSSSPKSSPAPHDKTGLREELDGHLEYLQSVCDETSGHPDAKVMASEALDTENGDNDKSVRLLTRQLQYRSERRMRQQYSDIQRRKKRTSFLRAVNADQPNKSGASKTNKKRKKLMENFAKPPVEVTHEFMLKELQDKIDNAENDSQRSIAMRHLETYEENYQNWMVVQGVKLDSARIKDRQDKERDLEENAKKYWIEGMTPVFVEIATVVPHASGGKIEEKPEIDFQADGLKKYLRPKPGDRAKQVQRQFKRFYYDMVCQSFSSLISQWPDPLGDGEEETGDTSQPSDFWSMTETEKQGFWSCDTCKSQLVQSETSGQLVCRTCGTTKQDTESLFMPSFSEVQSSVRGAVPYDRMAHVSSSLLLRRVVLGVGDKSIVLTGRGLMNLRELRKVVLARDVTFAWFFFDRA